MENTSDNCMAVIPKLEEDKVPKPVDFQYTWDEDDPPAIFVCRLCRKTFYNANALQNHKKTQHDDSEISCSEGDNKSPTYYDNSFISGVKFIPSEPPIEVGIETYHNGLTTRTFIEDTTYLIVKVEGDLDSLKSSPKRTHVKPKTLVDLRGPFMCTFMRPDRQCQQIFVNCCAYSLHYHEEHSKRRKAALRCQVCEKRLDKDQIMFSCRLCGLTFRESSQLDEHNRIAHAKTKPHVCPLCPKRFTQQGGLQQHMRMHTGARPFACTFCPKAFTQKAGLDQHLRTHTKVKPFRCVICSKTFSQSVHLRQHMRTHTNIQPFECSVCGRRFKQRSHLNFHVRSHLTAGTLPIESYARVMEENHFNMSEFLNLANVQPVQDGDTLYYAAEIAPPYHGNPRL